MLKGGLAVRLIFLCHAGTRSMREGGFPAPDEALDEGGKRKASELSFRFPDASVILCSPARAALETMHFAGLSGGVDQALRDIDHDDWSGRSFAAVHEADPDGLAAWIANPTGATPGGESFDHLVARIMPWLAGVAGGTDTVIAVTHPMIIRAALAVAIGIPADVTMRIDCGPLTQVELSFNRLWRLKAIRPD